MIFEPVERRERRWVSDTGLLLLVRLILLRVDDRYKRV